MQRLVSLLLVAAGLCPDLARAQRAVLAQAIARAEALGARTGVAACDAQGRVLHRVRAAEPFTPASNLKVLTAIAVLQGLSAEHTFRTRFRLADGTLVVEASGDPNWLAGSTHAPALVFGKLVEALHRVEATRLVGIELDAKDFVGPLRPATWPQDQLHTYYCAPTGPFVLEQGTFELEVQGGDGDSAMVRLLAPPVERPLTGSIELVDARTRPVYGAIDRGDAVFVRGRVSRRSGPLTFRTAVVDPTEWFRSTLQQALQNGGVRLDLAAGERPPYDMVVYQHESPLAPALARMLQDSSNFDAEQCLRVLGHETSKDGSLAGGVRALERQLERLCGALPSGVELHDGCGLSPGNRVTPGLLVVAMAKADARPFGAAFRAALPVAGETGTLADRFTQSPLRGRVRAKTGWIRGASSLSGCIEADGGRRWFSILMNYDRDKGGLNKELKQLQEQMVAAIANLEGT